MKSVSIDELKSAGKYELAGIKARLEGLPRQYGCHFGMKSSRELAIREFNCGWDFTDHELSGR